MSHKISVVIPCYNEEGFITKCLDSLAWQDYKDFDVIIVDNNSKDGSVGIVKNYQKRNLIDLKVMLCKKRGVSAARNMGWKNSRSEYIFFIDADEVLPANFLQDLAKHLKDPRIIIAAKRLSRASNFISKIRLIQNSPLDARQTAGLPRVFSRKCLQELKGFDESLEVNEDLDLRLRALKKGYKIEDKKIVWYHLEPDTFYEYISQASWMGKNYIQNFCKYRSRTIIFYGIHFVNLFPLLSLLSYSISFGLMELNLLSVILMSFWLLYQLLNVTRLYYYSKSFFSVFVPIFDILKSIFVFIGLVLRIRI